MQIVASAEYRPSDNERSNERTGGAHSNPSGSSRRNLSGDAATPIEKIG